MAPNYTTVGGYPNTDPYYISPEEEAEMEKDAVMSKEGEIALRPCPMCASSDLVRDRREWVECIACFSRAPKRWWNARPAEDALAEALEKLANAADDVGVKHFDTDSMSSEVEEMQRVTLAARAALALHRRK